MAANAQTGVDYDVDRFAIYSVSDAAFINLNAKWPRIDGGPIEGGNADLKYYKRVSADRPDIDHRYTLATTWSKADTTPAPADGYPSGEYREAHTATKLPIADLLLQIETEYQRQVRLQYPATSDPSLLVLAAKALVKQADGGALTQAETQALSAITATGDAVDQLVARKLALDASAEAGDDYDLSTGWTVV